MFFAYGEKEITYLKQKDKRLAEIIDKIGMIEREVDTDLFSAVIHHIIGQQISTKAQATIWKRMKDQYGIINADTILSAGVSNLQSLGISFRKAGYITDFARKVKDRTFDIDGIWKKSDEEAIKELSSFTVSEEATTDCATVSFWISTEDVTEDVGSSLLGLAVTFVLSRGFTRSWIKDITIKAIRILNHSRL